MNTKEAIQAIIDGKKCKKHFGDMIVIVDLMEIDLLMN